MHVNVGVGGVEYTVVLVVAAAIFRLHSWLI